jgi:hypothetical protein
MYQWRRSSDGGTTYADIAGATAGTYLFAGVNLADDGAVFKAVVRQDSRPRQAARAKAADAQYALTAASRHSQTAAADTLKPEAGCRHRTRECRHVAADSA